MQTLASNPEWPKRQRHRKSRKTPNLYSKPPRMKVDEQEVLEDTGGSKNLQLDT